MSKIIGFSLIMVKRLRLSSKGNQRQINKSGNARKTRKVLGSFDGQPFIASSRQETHFLCSAENVRNITSGHESKLNERR
jgi:hypothetical protein